MAAAKPDRIVRNENFLGMFETLSMMKKLPWKFVVNPRPRIPLKTIKKRLIANFNDDILSGNCSGGATRAGLGLVRT